MRPIRKITEKVVLPETTLGYRGLVISQIGEPVKELPRTFRFANGDLFGPGLAHRAEDEKFEDFICGSDHVRKFGKDFPEILSREIRNFIELRKKWVIVGPVIWPPLFKRCRCAPIYEPDWWNVSTIQPFNNCYNYSTNYRTDTYAQPGRAAGSMYTQLLCSSVKQAAISDELIDSPNANNLCPLEGHLVALVVWPGGDYHWYRKGKNGYWSHKPGGTAVTNFDNSGNLILDPRTADRGPYTDFCGFMVVKHGHIKIS